jgi:hypothetical protein
MAEEIGIDDIQPVTPHNKALYEAGTALLTETVEVGREFCKSMIGTAAAAIPIYLSLVGLAVGKDYRPETLEGAALLAAPALFLVAMATFAIGYFPVKSSFSLDVAEEIEDMRVRAADHRLKYAKSGFALLALGVIAAVGGALYALSIDVPSTPPPAR